MVISLQRDADLHMAQLTPLPLTVSCFSKIRIVFTFLVPAHPGGPGNRAVKRVCVSACKLWHLRVGRGLEIIMILARASTYLNPALRPMSHLIFYRAISLRLSSCTLRLCRIK